MLCFHDTTLIYRYAEMLFMLKPSQFQLPKSDNPLGTTGLTLPLYLLNLGFTIPNVAWHLAHAMLRTLVRDMAAIVAPGFNHDCHHALVQVFLYHSGDSPRRRGAFLLAGGHELVDDVLGVAESFWRRALEWC